MNHSLSRIGLKWLCWLAVVAAVVVGWKLRDRWIAPLRDLVRPSPIQAAASDEDHSDGHGHEHDAAASLELSGQARRNIGLKLGTIALENYAKTITVPSMVVDQPGRTHVQIAAPMTGIVTGVYIVPGETVRSDTLMFRMRLTHEDLVKAQTDFLRTLGQLDVEDREIARLSELTDKGLVAGKVLLEREYEKEKLEAALKADREALRLHGMSETQVAGIEKDRRLLRELEIRVPTVHDDASLHDDAETQHAPPLRPTTSDPEATGPVDHMHRIAEFVVDELRVQKGQSVPAGETLCVLADLGKLYIEGRAFEQDADKLAEAARNGWNATAIFESRADRPERIERLPIVYLSNKVDPQTRAFYFYVALPNVPVRDVAGPDERRYVTWKFKPGQRVNLHVPVEQWSGQIVLPVQAVVEEGAEAFVFQQNGERFDRRPVHVKYRDQHRVVIANDGSLFPGDVVAVSGAHQMQMALKQQAGAGGGHDHHGHMH